MLRQLLILTVLLVFVYSSSLDIDASRYYRLPLKIKLIYDNKALNSYLSRLNELKKTTATLIQISKSHNPKFHFYGRPR